MSDVDQIKQKIDIVSLISESVILKKTGANYKGLCPFHTEKTPSFIVSPERQIWHCFGGCQDGGDIFKFLMKIENIEFPEALKILAKRAGVKLSESYQTSKTAEIKEKIWEINHLASEFYHYILTDHPLGQKARDYLAKRQINSNSINLFSLGYSPNSWDSLTKYLAKKGYREDDLFSAGLISRSGIGHAFDRFRGRIIFTLKDHRGNVVGFAGRVLDPDAKEAKYVNTSETPVYIKGDVLYGLDVTREDIKKEGYAVVVEGELDLISSYQAGVRNIVAIKGSALTAGHVSLLKRYTENIYLALDSDYAGDAAAHRGIEIADSAGLNIKVVRVPGAKDPDELVREGPEGIAGWRKAIEEAVNFYDFVIDSALEKYDVTKPEEAKRVVSEVAKFIGPIENTVVKSHYVRKLAAALAMSEDDLEEQLNRDLRKGQLPTRVPEETAKQVRNLSRNDLLEEALLSLLLQAPNPADYLILIGQRIEAVDFTSPVLGKIYQLLWTFAGSPKSEVAIPVEKFDIKTFAKLVPAEILPTVDRLYLQENSMENNDEKEFLEMVQKIAWEIKELSLRGKLRQISLEIAKNPEGEDLNQEFTVTTNALQKLLEEKALLQVRA